MQGRAEKTRKRILEAAIKLFAAKGFSGTAVDEIAASAEVNKQRIYAYFTNKNMLFETVLSEAFASSNNYDRDLLALDEKDIPAMTGLIISHYMNTYRRRPEFWRLIAWANLEFNDILKSIQGIKSESLEHLRKLYYAGQKKKLFKNEKMSFENYIYILWASTFFYHSNKKTLQQSLGMELFSDKNQKSLLGDITELFQ